MVMLALPLVEPVVLISTKYILTVHEYGLYTYGSLFLIVND